MPAQYVDFGSHVDQIVWEYKHTARDLPGPSLDGSDSDNEETPDWKDHSNPDMVKSKARAIAKVALADLKRATSEADAERLQRQALRREHAAEGKKVTFATTKNEKKSTQIPVSIRAMLAQETLSANNAPTSAPRRTAIDPASRRPLVDQLKQDTRRTGFGAGKKPSTPAQLKTPATPNAQMTKGLGFKPEVAKTAKFDDGFDIVTSKGPSAANGSPLPDPDLIMDQLDVQFSPTLKGFQGWEDEYDSDDSEEWDLGGLAEWKWVGEKSAEETSEAKRQV
ncbi:hypothetical protein MBLNU13_g04189t1 [Cladosporium sp. NU13]